MCESTEIGTGTTGLDVATGMTGAAIVAGAVGTDAAGIWYVGNEEADIVNGAVTCVMDVTGALTVVTGVVLKAAGLGARADAIGGNNADVLDMPGIPGEAAVVKLCETVELEAILVTSPLPGSGEKARGGET